MNFKDIIGPDELDWKVIPLDWKKIGKDELKLGTPMSRDGLEANDAGCYGILMDDVEKGKHFQARVIVSGCVDFDKAEAYSGVKVSEEAKNAIGKVWSQGGGVSSWNDLTDKPFDENGAIMPEALPEGYPYKEQSEVVVFDKTITTVPLGTENGASGAQNPFTYDEMMQATQEAGIDMNEPFSLVFDGVPYTVQLVNMGSSTQYIGDYERLVLGHDGAEEYPFCIMFTPSMVVVATNDSGEHRMCISKLTETIHTMAPEFLPAGVGGGGAFYVKFTTTDNTNYTADKTFAEIVAADVAGQLIIGQVYNGTVKGANLNLTGYMADSSNGVTAVFFSNAYCFGDNLMMTSIMMQADGIMAQNKTMALS